MNQQAIDILDTLILSWKELKEKCVIPDSKCYTLDDMTEMLEEAKSRIQALWESSNNGWIPLTERLPEKDWMFYWYFWIVDKLHYSVSQNRWIDEIWEPKNPTHYMEIHYPLPPNK